MLGFDVSIPASSAPDLSVPPPIGEPGVRVVRGEAKRVVDCDWPRNVQKASLLPLLHAPPKPFCRRPRCWTLVLQTPAATATM